MQDRRDAGQVGCRTEGMQYIWGMAGRICRCRTRGMEDRRDAKLEGCRTGGTEDR